MSKEDNVQYYSTSLAFYIEYSDVTPKVIIFMAFFSWQVTTIDLHIFSYSVTIMDYSYIYCVIELHN